MRHAAHFAADTTPPAGMAAGSRRPAMEKVEFHDSRGRANFASLSLHDLVPDDQGALVIETGGDVLVIELSDFQEVVRRGIAPEGSQTQYFNVSGMDFCQFLDGTVLYFSAEDVRLVLAPE